MPVPRITPLMIGYLRADLSEWYRLPPVHPYGGRVDELPMQCYHIALKARSVLVDAAAYEFPEVEAKMAIPGFHAPSLLEQLRAAQIAALAISDVIITHAHFDHFNALTHLVDDRYVPAFPNARHYLGAGDWQPKRFGALEERTLKVVRQHGLLTLVEGPLDLGDGLSILPAPDDHVAVMLGGLPGQWVTGVGRQGFSLSVAAARPAPEGLIMNHSGRCRRRSRSI